MEETLSTFSDRIKSQLKIRGMKYGPTRLAREFNLRWPGAPITTNAARKWLYGQSTPRLEKIQVLAKMLDTSPDWLRWGENNNTYYSKLSNKYPSYGADLSDKQLLESLLNDWSLLNKSNKQVVCVLVDFLLRHQKNINY